MSRKQVLSSAVSVASRPRGGAEGADNTLYDHIRKNFLRQSAQYLKGSLTGAAASFAHTNRGTFAARGFPEG